MIEKNKIIEICAPLRFEKYNINFSKNALINYNIHINSLI